MRDYLEHLAQEQALRPAVTGAGAGTADGSLLTGVAPRTGNASGPGPGAAGFSAPA